VQADFLEQVFVIVVGVGFVSEDGRAFGQIQPEGFLNTLTSASEPAPRANSTGSPDSLTTRLHAQAVEVAPLAGDVAAERFATFFRGIKLATADADVVAHRHRQGIHHVVRLPWALRRSQRVVNVYLYSFGPNDLPRVGVCCILRWLAPAASRLSFIRATRDGKEKIR
jgi:hypothetical protein